jgi:hypothetical protein
LFRSGRGAWTREQREYEYLKKKRNAGEKKEEESFINYLKVKKMIIFNDPTCKKDVKKQG